MQTVDLGTMNYRDAWAAQERAHAAVLAGGEEALLLVEHTPVITFGRRGRTPTVLAAEAELARLGIEVVESDRGGDVTFHGPGQVVAYPILRLSDHKLSVGCYVRRLEQAAIQALARFGIRARLEPGAVGVWVNGSDGAPAAKICALGVRVRRGVTLHGIALNVTTDLRYFDLINPCGLGRPVTSIRALLGEASPTLAEVKAELRRCLSAALTMPTDCSAKTPEAIAASEH